MLVEIFMLVGSSSLFNHQLPNVSTVLSAGIMTHFLLDYLTVITYLHTTDMSSEYTPEMVRAYIDDLDAVYRQAIENGTLKDVFEQERSRIVSFFNNSTNI
jgi:hypothetical protein